MLTILITIVLGYLFIRALMAGISAFMIGSSTAVAVSKAIVDNTGPKTDKELKVQSIKQFIEENVEMEEY